MTTESAFIASDVLEQVKAVGAERATIALALKNQDAAYAIAEMLSGEDYQTPQYRAIFQVVKTLIGKGVEPTLSAVLDSADPYIIDRIKEAGGKPFLDRMMNFVDSIGNLDHWIEEIKAKTSIRTMIRKMEELSQVVMEEAVKAKPDHGAIMGMVEGEVDRLAMNVAGARTGVVKVCTSEDGRNDDFDDYYKIGVDSLENKDGIAGLKTGWPLFDSFIHGFQPGREYILAAKYKGGKSITLTEFAKRLGIGKHLVDLDEDVGTIDLTDGSQDAIDSRILDLSGTRNFRVVDLGSDATPGIIIDTEMRLERDVKPRLLASVAGVKQFMLRDGSWTKDPVIVERVREAHRLIHNSGIYFAHCNELHKFEVLRSMIRTAVHKHGARWILFDYIRKPPSERNRSEQEFIGDLAYFLKDDIAEKYGLALIAGAQFNRGATTEYRKREGGRAVSASDLGGSIKIAQAADMIMTLEDYDFDTPDQKFRIDESRYCGENGKQDWFHLSRDKDLARCDMGAIRSQQDLDL